MTLPKLHSQRNHTRLKFSPLTTSCTLRCLTPHSPLAQAFNPSTNVYDPNRSNTPSVVLPEVKATDPSGVFPSGVVNHLLLADTGKLEWFVNGKPISEVWTEYSNNTGDYSIITDETENRGALIIYKNVTADSKIMLSFRGLFYDWRTGRNYQVESDTIEMTTTNKGEDAISCSVDKQNVVYDPIRDPLLSYEWLYSVHNAEGLSETWARSSDDNYLQKINVLLNSGVSRLESLPSGLTMRLCKLGSDTALAVGNDNPELQQVEFPTIVIDCRLIDKAEYEVQMVKGGSIVARAPFSVSRQTTMPTSAQPFSGADILPSMSVYYNTLLVSLAGTPLANPFLYYKIMWFTVAQVYNSSANTYTEGSPKKWQTGDKLAAKIADIGIGTTVNDSYFEQYAEVEPWEYDYVLTDESGNVFTDENGNVLIG